MRDALQMQKPEGAMFASSGVRIPGRRPLLFAWFVCVGVAVAARPAWACGPDHCPVSRTLPSHDGELPANMLGFLWRPPCFDSVAPSDLDPKLLAVSPDGAAREIPFALEPRSYAEPRSPTGRVKMQYVHWDKELEPRTELYFSFDIPPMAELSWPRRDQDAGSDWSRARQHITVAYRARLPTTTGGLVGQPDTRLIRTLDPVTCNRGIRASFVDLKALVSRELVPWREALYMTTRVDGEPWAPYQDYIGIAETDQWLGGSVLGPNRDRVYLECDPPADGGVAHAGASQSLSAGHHSAYMIGYLPDGTEVRSETYEFDLACPEPAFWQRVDAGTATEQRQPADAGQSQSEPARNANAGLCAVTLVRAAPLPAPLMLLPAALMAWRRNKRGRLAARPRAVANL